MKNLIRYALLLSLFGTASCSKTQTLVNNPVLDSITKFQQNDQFRATVCLDFIKQAKAKYPLSPTYREVYSVEYYPIEKFCSIHKQLPKKDFIASQYHHPLPGPLYFLTINFNAVEEGVYLISWQNDLPKLLIEIQVIENFGLGGFMRDLSLKSCHEQSQTLHCEWNFEEVDYDLGLDQIQTIHTEFFLDCDFSTSATSACRVLTTKKDYLRIFNCDAYRNKKFPEFVRLAFNFLREKGLNPWQEQEDQDCLAHYSDTAYVLRFDEFFAAFTHPAQTPHFNQQGQIVLDERHELLNISRQ